MEWIFLSLFLAEFCLANEFTTGLGRIDAIHERANDLLKQAGVYGEIGTNENGPGEKSKAILNLHDLSTGRRISEGALLYASTKFRLLVGSQPSPVQVNLNASDKFPWTESLTLSGVATQNSGRIFIEFDRLFLPSGKAVNVQAVALDPVGSLGLKGSRENSKLLELAGGTALGLLTAPDNNPDVFGYGSVVRKSARERMRESLLDESKNYIRDELKDTPVLRVDMDTPLTVLMKGEVKL